MSPDNSHNKYLSGLRLKIRESKLETKLIPQCFPFMDDLKQQLLNITTFVLDVDGTLTDGQAFAIESDKLVRNLNSKDAFGLQYAARKGYRIVIMTGGSGRAVTDRLKQLGATDIFIFARDKEKTLTSFLEDTGINASEVLYMGDDVPDIPSFRIAGVSACPADSGEDALNEAQWITRQPGGRGAVREVIERVMKVQGKWYSEEAYHW